MAATNITFQPLEEDEDMSQMSEKMKSELLPQLLGIPSFVERNWRYLRNRNNLEGPGLFTVQKRIPKEHAYDLEYVKEIVEKALVMINKPGKVQVCMALLLENKRNEEFAFHYASNNTDLIMGNLPVIRKDKDIQSLIRYIANIDIADQMVQQVRENTSWVFRGFTGALIKVYKLPPPHVPVLLGAPGSEKLPKGLSHNKWIKDFSFKHSTGLSYYPEKFCFFRCMFYAINQKKLNEKAGKDYEKQIQNGGNKLAAWYCDQKGIDNRLFRGPFPLEDASLFETQFKCRLYFFEYTPNCKYRNVKEHGKVKTEKGCSLTPVRIPSPDTRSWQPYYFILTQEKTHCSFLKNIDRFLGIWICSKCSAMFRKGSYLNKHLKRDMCHKEDETREHSWSFWRKNTYELAPNIFKLSRAFGVKIPEEVEKTKYFAVFDTETMPVDTAEEQPNPKKLRFEKDLRLISLAAATNMEGFEALCWSNLESSSSAPQKIVNDFITYIEEVSRAVYKRYIRDYGWILDELREKARIQKEVKGLTEIFDYVSQKLQLRWRQLPVYSFYGKNFDHSVVLSYLVWNMKQRYEGEGGKKNEVEILKKASAYLQIAGPEFKLVDASCFISPGQSLANLLNLYKIPEKKLAFPHSLNCVEFLREPRLKFPPLECFADSLKGDTIQISKEDWERSRYFYEEQNHCQNMESYLKLYNLQDVLPFIMALEAHFNLFWKHFQLDLPSFLTLPSVAHRYFMDQRWPKLPLWLPRLPSSQDRYPGLTRDQMFVYREINEGLKGGFSCVFQRAQIRGTTLIKDGGKHSTGKIVCFDFNSLYPTQYLEYPDMVLFPEYWERVLPTSDKFLASYFAPKTISKVEMEMVTALDNVLYPKQVTYHALGPSGQWKPWIDSKTRVDYYAPETNEIYEMDGCLFHPNSNCLYAEKIKERKGVEEFEEAEDRSTKRAFDMRDAGFIVHRVEECKWDIMMQSRGQIVHKDLPDAIKENAKELANFVHKYFRENPFYTGHMMSEYDLLKKIQTDPSYSGLLKAEMVPESEQIRQQFTIYPPLFTKMDVSADMLGKQKENIQTAGTKKIYLQEMI